MYPQGKKLAQTDEPGAGTGDLEHRSAGPERLPPDLGGKPRPCDQSGEAQRVLPVAGTPGMTAGLRKGSFHVRGLLWSSKEITNKPTNTRMEDES